MQLNRAIPGNLLTVIDHHNNICAAEQIWCGYASRSFPSPRPQKQKVKGRLHQTTPFPKTKNFKIVKIVIIATTKTGR